MIALPPRLDPLKSALANLEFTPFNLLIGSKLRGCDLVRLRVNECAPAAR